MKYIRTKDGIYRTTKNFVVGKEHYVAWHDFYEEIIKQADTIEELCDEWVLPPQLNTKSYDTLNAKLFDFNSLKSYWAKAQKIIYGAIWTDKGLIYVAKMNEKGELELL